MSQSVIERVARAIAGSAAAAFGDRAIHYVENNWGAYTNQARAAISALREPSQDMADAGVNARESHGSVASVWEAMTDAALKEDS